jgi:hypothetical protein
MEDAKIETMQEVLRRLTALETKFEKVIIHEREAKFEIRYLDLKEACTCLGLKKSSMYRLMPGWQDTVCPYRGSSDGFWWKTWINSVRNRYRKGPTFGA